MFDSCNNCWFRISCTKKNEETTEKVCSTHAHMLSMFIDSNIPKNNWVKTDLFLPEDDPGVELVYKLSKDMEKFYKEPTNILIWSDKYLNGKTHWVFRLLQEYMILWTDLRFDDHPCVFYTSASEFLEKFKNQVDDKEPLNRIIAKMKTAEVLAIDDIDVLIGKEKPQELLAEILSTRNGSQLSNIFTSHISPPELQVKLTNNNLKNKAVEICDYYEFTSSRDDIKNIIEAEGKKDGE